MICGLLLTIEIMNESFSDVSVEPGMGLVFSPSLGRGQGRRVRVDTNNTFKGDIYTEKTAKGSRSCLSGDLHLTLHRYCQEYVLHSSDTVQTPPYLFPLSCLCSNGEGVKQ